MSIEVHTFTWRGIDIELIYHPNKWNVIAHLEVRSIQPKAAPLPITQTGYLSHHHSIGTVEATEGSLTDQVAAWLDEKAKSKDWIDHVERSRQCSLFDLL